ncbi:MAG: DUF6731 family protein [Verrucomicrobiales bacterium]
MRRSYKIDFYFVESGSGADFETILSRVAQLSEEGTDRNMGVGDDYIRLAHAGSDGDGFWGDLLRIRMAETAFRADLGGQMEGIQMESDQGFADGSAFYYDYSSGILVMQRNSRGPNKGHFCRYFVSMGKAEEPIELEPILHEGAVDKFRSMQNIKKVLVRVNVTDDLLTLDKLKPDAERALAMARDAEAREIEILLKSSKAQGGYLHKERAVEVVEGWLNVGKRLGPDAQVTKKAVVSGYDGSGQRLEFDILNDKIEMAMEVDVYPDADEYYQSRIAQIRRAWELHKTKLRKRARRAHSDDPPPAATETGDGGGDGYGDDDGYADAI